MSSGVLNKLPPPKLIKVAEVCWPSVAIFQERVHPHLATSIHAWEGIFQHMKEGSKEAGRYLAANYMSDEELLQTQQSAESNGEPFWETASRRLGEALHNSVNSIDIGPAFHASRFRRFQEADLTKVFRDKYYTGFSVGVTETTTGDNKGNIS
jgi:hypothetical protein